MNTLPVSEKDNSLQISTLSGTEITPGQLASAIAPLYREAFGESNWEEGFQCTTCGKKYRLSAAPAERTCISCRGSLSECYPLESTIAVLEQELKRTNLRLMLITDTLPIGFQWGWITDLPSLNKDKLDLSQEAFSQLESTLKSMVPERSAPDLWFYLSEIGVAPERRGQGLSSLMMKSLMSYVREQNLNMILRTSTQSELYLQLISYQFKEVFAYNDAYQRVLLIP